MKSVFVVMGQTGEYSDKCDWPVAAYLSERDAAAHEDAAQAAMDAVDRVLKVAPLLVRIETMRDFKNPHDKKAPELDTYGARYFTLVVELREKFEAPE